MIELRPLPPSEAIAFFRSKGLVASFAWQDVWQEEHGKAFTVAKGMSLEIVQDIRDAVDAAIADGTTLQAFKKRLQPILEARGWWGRKAMTDPLTGEDKTVQLGSPRRLRTIFDVNLRTAYSAGKWERVQRTKASAPYLRYVAIMDGRTRPAHRAWNGVTLPADDPWWQTHTPPCGWRCRCTFIQVSARTMERRGWTVTTSPPKFPPTTYTNPRTGEVSRVEGGIDPGFNYNPGKAYLSSATPKPTDPAAPGADLVPSALRLPPIDGPVLEHDQSRGELQAAFLGQLGVAPGQARVIEDVDGWPLAIGEGLFSAANGAAYPSTAELPGLALAGAALAHPAEIRWVVQGGVNGAVILRRYLATVRSGDQLVDVLVDVGARTWSYRTSLETPANDDWRIGELAWSRPAARA